MKSAVEGTVNNIQCDLYYAYHEIEDKRFLNDSLEVTRFTGDEAKTGIQDLTCPFRIHPILSIRKVAVLGSSLLFFSQLKCVTECT